jgi:hypothetical protein
VYLGVTVRTGIIHVGKRAFLPASGLVWFSGIDVLELFLTGMVSQFGRFGTAQLHLLRCFLKTTP